MRVEESGGNRIADIRNAFPPIQVLLEPTATTRIWLSGSRPEFVWIESVQSLFGEQYFSKRVDETVERNKIIASISDPLMTIQFCSTLIST